MKRMILSAVGAVLIGLSTPVLAEDLVPPKEAGIDVSGNVGLVSEYFFRGLTQSDNQPALQGGLDFVHNESGIYVGTWGSSVDFDDGGESNIELDLYGGWSGDLGTSGVTLDVGGIYYLYPGSDDDLDYDYFELYAGVSKDFKVASGGLKVSQSFDYFGGSGDSTYLEAGVDVPVGKYFTVNLHTGYQWIDENATFGTDDYLDYLLGVSFTVLGVDLQVAWIGTDLDDGECFRSECDAVVASIGKSF